MSVKSKFDLHCIPTRKVLFYVSLILLLIALVSSCVVYAFNNVSPIVPKTFDKAVSNETGLHEVIANNAIDAIIIALDRDIQLTESFTIPTGKDITLTSSNNKNGFCKLIGANNESTIFIEKNGVLRLDGIIVMHINGEVGRGVTVNFGGTLIMTDGMICNNIDGFAVYAGYAGLLPQDGGGVYNSGSFSMYGGEISNNTSYGSGGGVYNNGYDFTMYGGKISGNAASAGGGVSNYNGKILLCGGSISDNAVKGAGGGVDIFYGSFVMSGGVISGNVAWDKGGGVYSYFMFSSFSMSGGEITNNTASMGGGVCTDYEFTMAGGVVSGNVADTGGGVYVGNGSFSNIGGVVSGNTASQTSNDVYRQK
jgi:hypothetical protein